MLSESALSWMREPPGAIRLADMEILERDLLLEELDNALADAGRGHGRLVLVRGEAGIGKTTLVREFTAGRARRTLWGICDPVEPPRPLAPVFDIAGQAGGELQLAPSTAATGTGSCSPSWPCSGPMEARGYWCWRTCRGPTMPLWTSSRWSGGASISFRPWWSLLSGTKRSGPATYCPELLVTFRERQLWGSMCHSCR